jgi:hypothetical protein
MQMLAFSGLLLFILPAIAIDGSGGNWLNPATRPIWQLSLIAQGLTIPALFGSPPFKSLLFAVAEPRFPLIRLDGL